MKKTILIPIISCIAILVLQQCKTHKEAISDKSTTKKANQSIKEDSVPIDIFSMQPDSTIYIFSEEDIEKIKKQIPSELLPYPPLPGQDYDEQTLLLLMSTTMETKKALEYLPVFTNNSTKTTKAEQTSKKYNNFFNQLENSQIQGEETGQLYYLQKADTNLLPMILKKVFPNVMFYYVKIIEPPDKYINAIFNNERYNLGSDFNVLLNKMPHHNEIVLNDKIECLILIKEGLDKKLIIKETKRTSINIKNWDCIFNYEIITTINDKPVKYYLYLEEEQPLLLVKYIKDKYNSCLLIRKR